MTEGQQGAQLVDYPALVTGLLAGLRNGPQPLAALQQLIGGLVGALGAECGSVATYCDGAGRLIAATPGSDWALGRPVERAHPAVLRLAAGDCTDLDVRRDMPTDLADQYLARGLRRAAAVGVLSADGRLVGSLHLYFRDPGGALTPEQRSALLLVARLVYRIFPLERSEVGDGPLAAALADGLAVLAPDGLVRSWNPAAQVLTGITAGAAVGQLAPFEVPPVGQVGEQQMPDGRWLQVLCSALTRSDDCVVTFRDITAARRREQVKDLFVATASHELRTPVTVMRGYADTLYRRWDQLDEPSRQQAIRAIRDRAERLATLVDRLLVGGDDGRVDAMLVPVVFDLVGTLHSAVSRLGADEAARLVVEMPGSLPDAVGDPGSVSTVLTELVANAHKYSPGGGPVTLSAGTDERTVYFRVADRGIGVKEDLVERAFDRFWQAEGTDRRRFGGVGLGLYLVRRIVEGQEGWVSLRPGNPDGTVAEVRLRRAGVTSGEA